MAVHKPNYSGAQLGFTLVELMISAALSILLASGVLLAFSAAKTSFVTSSSINNMQETGRYSTHAVAQDVRLAGYWGINSLPSAITETNTSAKTYGCGLAGWLLDVDRPQEVLESPSNAELPSCIKKADYLAGTDILIVRHVGPPLLSNAAIEIGQLYLHSGAFIGKIFEAESNGNIPASADFNEQPVTVVYPFQTNIYFVRKCSSLGSNDKCDATDDTIPTLVKLSIDKGAIVAEEISENIESLQVLLGINSDSIAGVDKLSKASASIDWGQVKSLEVSLLVRSPTREFGHLENLDGPKDPFNSGKRGSYTLGGETIEMTDEFRRQIYSTTIYIRN